MRVSELPDHIKVLALENTLSDLEIYAKPGKDNLIGLSFIYTGTHQGAYFWRVVQAYGCSDHSEILKNLYYEY